MTHSVVFLGAKRIGYECLSFLVRHAKELDVNVTALLTNDQARVVSHEFESTETVRKLGEDHGIPILNDLESLLSHSPIDVLISVQYHKILKTEHINLARNIAVNLHMAPLPEYRGCNQFSFAIINNDSEFGTTLHKMEPGVDDGAIIAERRFPIPQDCFVQELYNLTARHSFELFESKIANILRGDYTLVPQETLLTRRKISFHKRSEIEDMKAIDWSWPKDKIERYIRATAMPGFPPPYATIAGKKIQFLL